MCEMTKTLKNIAEQLVKKDHREISAVMNEQDKIDFVNAIATLNEHAHFIQRTNVFNVR